MAMTAILARTALAAVALTATLSAQTSPAPRINKDRTLVALRGYDVVAYFTDAKPVAGRAEFEHRWQGARWRFDTAEHRDLFAAAPEKYAPQYGGFCAWAVSRNYTAPVDPKAWTIVNGRLYLNYSLDVQDTWSQDRAGNIAKADANWPALSHTNK
jgi:hypothetical protein